MSTLTYSLDEYTPFVSDLYEQLEPGMTLGKVKLQHVQNFNRNSFFKIDETAVTIEESVKGIVD